MSISHRGDARPAQISHFRSKDWRQGLCSQRAWLPAPIICPVKSVLPLLIRRTLCCFKFNYFKIIVNSYECRNNFNKLINSLFSIMFAWRFAWMETYPYIWSKSCQNIILHCGYCVMDQISMLQIKIRSKKPGKHTCRYDYVKALWRGWSKIIFYSHLVRYRFCAWGWRWMAHVISFKAFPRLCTYHKYIQSSNI